MNDKYRKIRIDLGACCQQVQLALHWLAKMTFELSWNQVFRGIILSVVLASCQGSLDETCTAADCQSIVVSVAMLQFRSDPAITKYSFEDFDALFTNGVEDVTNGLVQIRVDARRVIPFPRQDPRHDYTDLGPDDLMYLLEEDYPRVWYLRKGVYQIIADVEQAADDIDFSDFDVIVVITDLQLETFSIHVPGEPSYIVTSNLVLGGYYPEYTREAKTDYFLVDSVLHEFGHFMGLRHSCEDICIEDPVRCCDTCPVPEDLMNPVCRTRPSLSEDQYYNRFADCSLEHIQSTFVPAFIENRRLESDRFPQQETTCDKLSTDNSSELKAEKLDTQL